MPAYRISVSLALLALTAGCIEEPPPRSVTEYMSNPIMLEAAVVRCAQNRAESKYDPECINAREAVKLIEAKEEANRRADLEAQSKRKRDALRRTQRAAAEARRRTAEARRTREEADYIAQFGETPPPQDGESEQSGNVPMAVIPEAVEPEFEDNAPVREFVDNLPVDGSNAPVIETEPEEETPRDLASIRDELQRRNEENGE